VKIVSHISSRVPSLKIEHSSAELPALEHQTANGITYFKVGSSKLTAEGKEKIKLDAEQWKNETKAVGNFEIEVTGYASATGSEKLNDKLSLARAEAVKRELVANGVPAAWVYTHGEGSEHLAVKTKNEDAHNRRATVVFGQPSHQSAASGNITSTTMRLPSPHG
jgi:outer membrane protein OmpA-like peptidoglycan-associated protein